jgi:hypothetical protein
VWVKVFGLVLKSYPDLVWMKAMELMRYHDLELVKALVFDYAQEKDSNFVLVVLAKAQE